MSVLSRIAHDWAVRCFGKPHVINLGIRALRTLEEAAELAQAYGVPEDTALKCIRTVYGRPVGDPIQEIGGVLNTIVVLCQELGVEADDVLEREVLRCLAKSPEHFRKRNQEKLDLGLDATEAVQLRTAREIEAERKATKGCTCKGAKEGHFPGCPLNSVSFKNGGTYAGDQDLAELSHTSKGR